MRCIRFASRAWRQSSIFCANLTESTQPEQTSLTVVCKPFNSRHTSRRGLSSYPARAFSSPFGLTFSSSTAVFRLGTAPSLQSQACRSASSIIQFPLAQTGEGIKECELTEWFVEKGSRVEEFQKICEVQSDKAAVEITSRYAGLIKQLYHSPGDLVQTVPEPPSEYDDTPVASVRQKSPQGYKVFASPATKHLAKENNIDLASVNGTGPEGRITREDVLKILEKQAYSATHNTQSTLSSSQTTPTSPSTSASNETPIATPSAESTKSPPGHTIVPLRGYKRAMVKSMVQAGAIPHFHLCDELDMRAVLALRKAVKEDSVLQGVHLTFLPIMIKALSAALEEFPMLNSSLNSKADALLQHTPHNIGVAMATPAGLVVPNIKDVQKRNVAGIAAELTRLQRDATLGRVNQFDVTGGTISMSNIGTIGGTYATPLVNPPEVAIVALGKLRYLPRFASDGEVEKVAVMNVSWGADHRVVDGATLAEFNNKWKMYVEQPERVLLRLA